MKRNILSFLNTRALMRSACLGIVIASVHTLLPFSTPCVPKAATPDVDTLWTIVDRVQAVVAGQTSFIISQDLLDQNIGLTINLPGTYILCEDLFNNGFGSVPLITINSPNVILNLNGYSITQNGLSLVGDPSAITVLSNANDVVIQNGMINLVENTGGNTLTGIIVQSTVQNVVISDIVIKGNAPGANPTQIGISLGDPSDVVTAVLIANTAISYVNTGVLMRNAVDIACIACAVQNINNGNGFQVNAGNIFGSQNCIFRNCSVIGASSSTGYLVQVEGDVPAGGIVFESCIAIDTTTQNQGSGDGFRAEMLANATQPYTGILFKNCIATGWGRNGFIFITDANNSVTGYSGAAIGCLAAGCFQSGFSIDSVPDDSVAYTIRSCVGLDNNRAAGGFANFLDNNAGPLEGAVNNFANLAAGAAYINIAHTINICGTGNIQSLTDDIAFSNYYHNAFGDS